MASLADARIVFHDGRMDQPARTRPDSTKLYGTEPDRTEPDRIHLRDHVVEAEIGAFQTERGQTQRLRFNVTADLAAPVSGAGDEVDRILSYDVLTGAVAAGLSDRRYDLLETLAERIAAEVLAHPAAARVEVSVEKLDRVPGALGVTVARRAGQVAADPARTGPARTGPVVLLRLDGAAPPADCAGPLVIVPDAPRLPLPEGGDARRVALLALDQAAWAMAGPLGLTVADSRTELDWATAERRAVVWAPTRLVADDPDVPADPLALALWLAGRLGAERLDIADAPGEHAAIPADFRIPVRRLPG